MGYVKCGFEAKAPLVMMERPGNSSGIMTPAQAESAIEGLSVRLMKPTDVEECIALCNRICKCDRSGEIQAAITSESGFYGKKRTMLVVLKDEKIVGYTLGLTLDGHTVCENTEVARTLFASIQNDYSSASDTLRTLLPVVDNPELLAWCLQNGWRLLKQMLLMVHGPYESPLS